MKTNNLILLIEDDPADQLMVHRALEGSSIESRLHAANDGEEGLDYLQRMDSGVESELSPLPDLVLVDLNMPKIDGREFVVTVRKNPRLRHLPIVVLTTSSDRNDVADLYEKGVDAYIVKPKSLDELERALITLLEYWFRLVERRPPLRN